MASAMQALELACQVLAMKGHWDKAIQEQELD
jgi:hypothetical protein